MSSPCQYGLFVQTPVITAVPLQVLFHFSPVKTATTPQSSSPPHVTRPTIYPIREVFPAILTAIKSQPFCLLAIFPRCSRDFCVQTANGHPLAWVWPVVPCTHSTDMTSCNHNTWRIGKVCDTQLISCLLSRLWAVFWNKKTPNCRMFGIYKKSRLVIIHSIFRYFYIMQVNNKYCLGFLMA